MNFLHRVRDVLALVPPAEVTSTGWKGAFSALAPSSDAVLKRLDGLRRSEGSEGGREMDGPSHGRLPLHDVWEHYVEARVRREAALVGGNVRVGRKRETVFPIDWSDPSHRSLGHLVPDIVVFNARSVHIIDAKYKAHLAELDEHGWQRFTEDTREAHRADIHQVLAYASLYSAEEVSASLVYPLRRATFEALACRGRDRSVAHLLHGARRVRLELRGMPLLARHWEWDG